MDEKILTEAEKLDRVEKVMTKSGVNYESANSALKACDWDILESLIYLEKLGKIENGFTSYYNTDEGNKSQYVTIYDDYTVKRNKEGQSQSFWDGVKRIIKKGCDTFFDIDKKGERIMSVPVIVLVLALALAFWITLPLLIVGLFLDCRYSFRGIEKTSIDLNDVCNKASNLAGDIKTNVKNQHEKSSNDDSDIK